MNIHINKVSDCCGCTACESICPKDAIKMEPDAMGFLYPKIDENKCIDCGLCVKTCQFNNSYTRYQNFDEPLVFGVRHKDENELSLSQSGAASWGITQAFLTEGGKVYGAAFKEVYHVVHTCAYDLEQAQQFRCSKYVQSDLRGVFEKIKTDLKRGVRVLFFGTGCQVAGLKSAMPTRLHPNLTTVDIVCHASPAPAVWESFVKYVENKTGKKVVKASFRNKKFGWHSHVDTLEFSDGTPIYESTSFRKLFYDHIIVRPSCTVCHFTNLKRVGDITICDFWGWEKTHIEWCDNKGVSVLMVNSDKGEQLFERSKLYLHYRESNAIECLQPQLQMPISSNLKDIAKAKRIFAKSGYQGLAKAYGDQSLSFKFKEKIRSLLQLFNLK